MMAGRFLGNLRWVASVFAILLLCVGAQHVDAQTGGNPSRPGTRPDNGGGSNFGGGASTVQLPTFGVAIDAEGVLTLKFFPDPGGRLRAARVAAARRGLEADVVARHGLRKVSLVKLERAIRKKLDAGEAPDDVMRNLAGLQRVQFVFFYPEEGDIVLAGPAEGWMKDLSGRTVGITSGRPVVLLEDLIVALRAFSPGGRRNPFIGCTIDPDPEGLARLQKFQRTIPKTIPQRGRNFVAAQIAQGMRNSLGMANIRVFGISDKTHLAQVLIEADYRMKLIGIGLEPPPIKMPTFASSLKRARSSSLQRWWFTPNYDCVKVTEDRLAMELVGQGVQLLGEDKLIGPDGALAAGVKSSKASELYTTVFTKKYPEISAASPVYAQMRNAIDLVVAAAFIRKQDFYGRADWTLGLFADEASLPVETLANPKQVACVVNSFWKGNRLLSPAGGGVSLRPDQALQADRLIADTDGRLGAIYRHIGKAPPTERWWWD